MIILCLIFKRPFACLLAHQLNDIVIFIWENSDMIVLCKLYSTSCQPLTVTETKYFVSYK